MEILYPDDGGIEADVGSAEGPNRPSCDVRPSKLFPDKSEFSLLLQWFRLPHSSWNGKIVCLLAKIHQIWSVQTNPPNLPSLKSRYCSPRNAQKQTNTLGPKGGPRDPQRVAPKFSAQVYRSVDASTSSTEPPELQIGFTIGFLLGIIGLKWIKMD